jgi:hypothetical protein
VAHKNFVQARQFYIEVDENKQTQRDLMNEWKDKLYGLIKKSGKPVTPKQASLGTGVNLSTLRRRLKFFNKTFVPITPLIHERSMNGQYDKLLGIDIHPDLKRHLEYEKTFK